MVNLFRQFLKELRILGCNGFGISLSLFGSGLLRISDAGIREVITCYTRESGVRNLEREIGSLCRKVARQKVAKKGNDFKITPTSLEKYLGKKKFRYDIVEGESEVGVVTGMAWTQVGGDTLFVETAKVPGTGKIQLTGQLGDVMKESAKAAISYIRSQSERLGIDPDFYKNKDIHIHVPEGAVPKDGPSAGITMATSLASALTKRKVKANLAMTGEISLRGKVLPVGGIKEKILAAKRAGIKEIILCEENRKNIEEIPEMYLTGLTFHYVTDIKEVWQIALLDEKVG